MTNAEVIYMAVSDSVVNIGQLTKEQLKLLNKAVKNGILDKGKGGHFPKLKTVYARKGFDFEKDRKDFIKIIMSYPGIKQ